MCNSVKSSNQFLKCQEANVSELKLGQYDGVSGSGWQKISFCFEVPFEECRIEGNVLGFWLSVNGWRSFLVHKKFSI